MLVSIHRLKLIAWFTCTLLCYFIGQLLYCMYLIDWIDVVNISAAA